MQGRDMVLKRKLYSGAAEALAENRQVVVVISTDDVDRQGDIVVQDGIVLDAYRANPVVLWQHDAMLPIARCVEIGITDGRLRALVQFPPEGTSEKADEVYGLIRSGVINASSIGFLPIDAEPVAEKQPWAGQRFLKCELLEFSFVSVPANRGATVTERSAQIGEEPMTGKTAVKLTLKGLYEVGWLAHLLDSLGCLHDMTALEAAAEGDGSAVPGMIADALQQLGAALVAMTAEEVAELLAGKEEPEGEDDAGDAEVVLRRVKAFRAGLKAGRVLSTANHKRLKEALGHHDKALEQHKAAGDHHEAAGEHLDAISDAHGAAQEAHEALGKSLAAAQEQPEQAAKHVKAALRKHAALGKQLGTLAEHKDALGESHDALGDAHRAIGRSVKAIGRCIKAVTDTADDSAESEEAAEGQGGVSGTSDPDKSALRRRVTVLRLQGAA